MSNNKETRELRKSVHLFLAIQREGTSKDKKCIRTVIKDEELDLKILEAKLKVIGSTWRVHRTVNARNCEKARIHLLKFLIDHPERASSIDTEWRTALLQRHCKETNYFMLDIDTIEDEKLNLVEQILKQLNVKILGITISPKGRHYITEPFDTREICKLNYVSLLRDGYFFVKEVKNLTN